MQIVTSFEFAIRRIKYEDTSLVTKKTLIVILNSESCPVWALMCKKKLEEYIMAQFKPFMAQT